MDRLSHPVPDPFVLFLLRCFLFSPHSRSPWLLLTMTVLDHSVSSLKSLSKWLCIHSAECGCHYGVSPTPASASVCVCLSPRHPVPSPPASRKGMSLLSGEQALCPHPSAYLGVSSSSCHSPAPSPPQFLFSAHVCPLVCTDVAPGFHLMAPPSSLSALKQLLPFFAIDLT